jgi:hypothetical protein
MPSFGPPPIEIGMGSNAANARRPARNPPICACHAIACSTPAMLIELQWPPPEAQGRVIGPERPTRLPAEAVEREGREPTLGPPGHVQVGYRRCVPCSASYPTAYACLNGVTSIRPLVLTTADCASAIARSAHVTTRAMSMIAPTNLRRRTGIFQLREQAHNYTVRAARVPIPKFEWYLDLKFLCGLAANSWELQILHTSGKRMIA